MRHTVAAYTNPPMLSRASASSSTAVSLCLLAIWLVLCLRNTSCARAKAFCKALCCKWCFSHPFEHSGFVTSVSPHRAAPAASRCWLVTSSRTARLFNPQLHELATAVGCMMRPPEGNSITLLLAVLGYVTVCAWPPIHSIGNTMGRHICLGTICHPCYDQKETLADGTNTYACDHGVASDIG